MGRKNIKGILNIPLFNSSNLTKITMKTLKFKTAVKQIQEGKIECVTDLKIGYVEIFNLSSRKRNFIEIV